MLHGHIYDTNLTSGIVEIYCMWQNYNMGWKNQCCSTTANVGLTHTLQ